MVKTPNWQEADQLAIYKRGRGVELGATEKQLQPAVSAGLEPGTSRFLVRHPKHLTTLRCLEIESNTFERLIWLLKPLTILREIQSKSSPNFLIIKITFPNLLQGQVGIIILKR